MGLSISVLLSVYEKNSVDFLVWDVIPVMYLHPVFCTQFSSWLINSSALTTKKREIRERRSLFYEYEETWQCMFCSLCAFSKAKLHES